MPGTDTHDSGHAQALLTPQAKEHLAKLLGMLGSDHAGERAAAALKADQHVKRANPPAPRIKVRAGNNSVHEISADYPDDTVGWLRIMDALGVKDFDAASGLVQQIANAGTQGRGPDETGVNSMLSFVKGIEPLRSALPSKADVTAGID